MGKAAIRRTTNVLIVDSDPTYLRLWEKIFEGIEGCKFSITNDPDAAINLIKTRKIDLVISEIVMSKKDGYLIANIANKYQPQTEILLTTGYDCDLTRFNLENPKFHLLHKPYHKIEEIQKFVKHLLNHENVYDDASEDSFSENDVYPSVMEWKL